MIKWAVYKIYCASSTVIKHERVCVSKLYTPPREIDVDIDVVWI